MPLMRSSPERSSIGCAERRHRNHLSPGGTGRGGVDENPAFHEDIHSAATSAWTPSTLISGKPPGGCTGNQAGRTDRTTHERTERRDLFSNPVTGLQLRVSENSRSLHQDTGRTCSRRRSVCDRDPSSGNIFIRAASVRIVSGPLTTRPAALMRTIVPATSRFADHQAGPVQRDIPADGTGYRSITSQYIRVTIRTDLIPD